MSGLIKKVQCDLVKANNEINTGTHSTGPATVGGDPCEQTSCTALDQGRATVHHWKSICLQ